MNDCFRITLSFENVAATKQVLPKLLIIVDFTVENDMNAAVFIGQRLVAAAEVNDGEATETQADRARNRVTVVIVTTMSDGVGHALDESGSDRGRRIENQFSADSAHFIVFGYASD